MSAPRRAIVAAAVKHDGMVCFVPRPGRHYHVLRQMAAAGINIPITGEQGFVTSDGVFVGRYEARDIAREAGQLIPRNGSGVPHVMQHPQLFSEDVW